MESTAVNRGEVASNVRPGRPRVAVTSIADGETDLTSWEKWSFP